MYESTVFLRDLNHSLNNYVKNLGRDDLKTVEALLIDLTGNESAARMLNRLIYWWPRAKKAGGWVYKSAKDWYAECRLSKAKVSTVHAGGILEAIGIERKNMKANGNPTIHYRLNIQQFLEALAKFAGVTVAQVKTWMADNTQNESLESGKTFASETEEPLSSNEEIVFPEGGKTITYTYKTNKTEQDETNKQTELSVVAEKNQDFQLNDEIPVTPELEADIPPIPLLPRNLALELVNQYGLEFVQAVANYAARQDTLRNPVGWIRSELKHNRLHLTERAGVFDDPAAGLRFITGKYGAFFEWQ